MLCRWLNTTTLYFNSPLSALFYGMHSMRNDVSLGIHFINEWFINIGISGKLPSYCTPFYTQFGYVEILILELLTLCTFQFPKCSFNGGKNLLVECCIHATEFQIYIMLGVKILEYSSLIYSYARKRLKVYYNFAKRSPVYIYTELFQVLLAVPNSLFIETMLR